MNTPSSQSSKRINIQGDGNVVGDHNRVSVYKIESSSIEFNEAFATIYASVEKLSDPVIQNDARELVHKIETEAQKGEAANPSNVERWIKFLAETAPDVWEVLVDTLCHPIKGISTVITKVIEKSQKTA